MGSRFGHSFTASALLLACSLLPGFARAQAGCIDDVDLEIRDERAGVVSLRDASLREVTGRNQDDRERRLSYPGTATGSTQGGRFLADLGVASLAPDDVSTGFERRENRFWEANYPRGMYEFDRRQDLDVEAIVTVVGNSAVATAGNTASRVTLVAETSGIQSFWWGGTNSLRQLRGRVSFDYSDLDRLRQHGTHRATLNICIMVRNYL